MSKKYIRVKGAKEHNLKNIDIDIPRDEFVVITGLSGSGKSSLAFDTIYAEGQRRYVESLSSYARQFLGQMEKPDVEYIEGLSPAISIDQKTTNRNPRSTVGTVTEIYDYLRLLYARIGLPHCPICGEIIEQQSVDQIVDSIMKIKSDTKIQIIAPIIIGKKGEHKNEIEKIRKEGFVRVRIDGELKDISEEIKLDKKIKHSIDIIVDRLKIKEGIETRLTDSIETVLKLTENLITINIINEDKDLSFNTKFACSKHGISLSELEPRIFSFNAPYGACEKCKGLGYDSKVDKDLVIPDYTLCLKEGAIAPLANSGEGTYYLQLVTTVLVDNGYDTSTPFNKLPKKVIKEILYGTGKRELEFNYESKFGGVRKYKAPYEGMITNLERRYNETNSDYMHKKIEEYMSVVKCDKCGGKKLKDEVLAVTIDGINISDITEYSVRDSIEFFKNLTNNLSVKNNIIAEQILKEINGRLEFLKNVGLDYLNLARTAKTLSGGESQRIRLATQIGSGLVGVLYILDEPSIGLHQKDNHKLLVTLRKLTDIGNTLIVVEHDEETIASADHIIDIGPGAGEHGGYVIAEGTIDDILVNENSLTGQYMSGKKVIEVPKRRKHRDEWISVKGASENNLKNIDVDFPLGVFTVVTGVSGSGKSTLVNEILYKSVANKLYKSKAKPGKHTGIEGLDLIDKVIDIDQSPIGRTPRSNPATYTGVFDHIRDIFAKTKEANKRGYKKGRFSFNVKGGRCETCKGDGIIKIEMHFLPDVYVQCEVCKGKRYNRETLEVKYKGKNIYDILNMTVEEALSFFENVPQIKRKLQTLHDVGLDYIKLGQPSTQLSGGEAQRIKLASELSKRSTGRTLYILDEPTTGLHMADVHNLIEVLQRLVDTGNTVLIIEHNLDMIKSCDYVIDLGPDGGDKGGTVVVCGTPEHIAADKVSYTGEYLRKVLKQNGI
ncbi:excinuclease ABC subunit UvrA [Helicovermis profundi]|uniref:UvrABC system protein A n=1 Tax=Helicovermis profundi TaxID=3065157 RepID=A0AAU9E754_9FIRM|nr:excinuclease ABC subunit UvrA [Clostridia bacterium S502]